MTVTTCTFATWNGPCGQPAFGPNGRAGKHEPRCAAHGGPAQSREKRSGRYGFEGGHDRLCVCGHRLGVHLAERARRDGKSYQECINHDVGDGASCDCQCFKPSGKRAVLPNGLERK